MFPTFPAPRLRLQDEDFVRALAAQVVAALRNAIAGRPAGEQPLAVGLIGAPRQLPTMFSFDEASRHCSELEGLVDHGVDSSSACGGVFGAVHRATGAHDCGP
jgi:hypothetical protein